MNKKEFLKLDNMLNKFYEEHNLEFLSKNENDAMKLVKSMVVDYITHIKEDESKYTSVYDHMKEIGEL